MLNSPLPPDISVTERLQKVIAEWKGAHQGHPLEQLFRDCLDLVGSEKQLLPLRLMAVQDLDSENLARALRPYRLPLEYAVGTVGHFDSALVPVLRESGPAAGFLFVYEENLRRQDQVALFAHAVGHLILNEQARLKEQELPLAPDEGEIHTDRLAELRYLDIARNRNHLDRQVLDAFQDLTGLIEPPEESQVAQQSATRALPPLLRRQGWVNQYVRLHYWYTQGRVIPHSQQRGKRLTIDALLYAEPSLLTAVVHVQRPEEELAEAVGRVRSAAHQLGVPFAYVLTHQQEIIELHWLNGDLAEPQIRATFPDREELRSRWLSALQLADAKSLDTLSYPYDPTQRPRYYQEAAINQAVIAALQARKGLRDRRILLTLATGTGKTQVAFQILWKLKKSFRVRNILFLADRSYLLDQARLNTFGPFRDAIARGMGEIDTAHDILFASYQWLAMLQDGVELYKGYPSDYFDVIVIDECHRGSADENSKWRSVLEHFSEAIQIGLTATPLETRDVQTRRYFGPSVYTYSLSQGINDGYLAPYSVRRVLIEKEGQRPPDAPAARPVETLDQQIVMQTGHTMRQYTQTIAEHLSRYLQLQSDPRAQKTIVFCVDNEHADQMRLALEKACKAWARPGDIVRIVDDDGPEGKRALGQFCTIRERQPVIVTTARLLSTGVDVPTCKNIVLARAVGSMVEFKQIIGRGTRIWEQEKTWFTIIDYAGAIKHFSDPAFDGDPTSVQREYLPATPASPTPDNETAQPAVPVTPTSGSAEASSITNVHEEQTTAQPEPSAILPTPDSSQIKETLDPPYEPETPASNTPAGATLPQEAMEQGGAERRQSDTAQPEPSAQPVSPDQQTCQGADFTVKPAHQNAPATPPQPRSDRPRGGRRPPNPPQPAQNTEEKTIERPDGHRFVVGDVISYELDASGARLRTGTPSDFTRDALKDMIKTPEDLRKYWLDQPSRELLTDQLTREVVALDALSSSLDLPEVDYYDLLLYVLFQQPPITRAERVARLRATHSAFFQRFAHNLLAKELLDVILEKYIQGDAPNVSDMELLSVPPLTVRRPMEWVQIFSQGTPKANLNTTLKELQQLLYSV